jgi:hypothetical protein
MMHDGFSRVVARAPVTRPSKWVRLDVPAVGGARDPSTSSGALVTSGCPGRAHRSFALSFIGI